jgi:ParB family chromosome partitioning protein
MLQPIVVRRTGNRFQLVSGERRLRAAIKAGWTDIPVQIRDVDNRQMAELAIVENLQRKDLNPLEKAASFQRYLTEYGCTQDDLASRLKIDRSTIANLIRLLELPEKVQDAVRKGSITQGHARALLPLAEEAEQITACEQIAREGWSVRATEDWVRQRLSDDDGGGRGVVDRPGQLIPMRPSTSPNIVELERALRAALGVKVDLKQTGRGAGRIVIHFKSHEEFARLRLHLCGAPAQVAKTG